MTDTNTYLKEACSPLATLSEEEATHALGLIDDTVKACNKCEQLSQLRNNTVFGAGNSQPTLVFIGEAPGHHEDMQGEPFVGRAGELLDKIISACGMRREEVYICNILKCRPPENRRPLPGEVGNCMRFLNAQLAILKPKLICTLGATAAQSLFDIPDNMGELRGRILDHKGIPVICTYHPAFLLRNPEIKRHVWDDMKKVMQHLGRPIKPKS